jgi:xylulokinase
MTLFLGVDVGSSGCKVVAVDRAGAIVANGQQAYPTHHPEVGWAEQDPEDWYRAACGAIRLCLETVQPGQIAALSITGPAHNIALLGGEGEIVYPTIHWSDLRSTAQSQRLEQTHGKTIFRTTFSRVNPSWSLTQLLWLKENEPEVWRRLRRVLVTKDYVRYRLTGISLTDAYDAIGTQLYDVEAGRWSNDLCALIGLDPALLPTVAGAGEMGGAVQPSAAKDTGLKAGTPVAVGSGDSVVEAFGIGAIEPGDGIVKLGTAANVNLVTQAPRPTPRSITYQHVTGDRWFTITATNSGTATMRWFRDAFCGPEVERAGADGADAYQLIGALAAEAPPGAEGMVFHPYLMGERSPHWDPYLRGDFIGVSARHRKPHFARAMMEGVAYSIRDCFEMVADLGEPIHSLYAMGGGMKNALWRQIIADVLGRTLVKPSVEGASFGAALLAAVAVGAFDGWTTAARACAATQTKVIPNPALNESYNAYFAVYRSVVHDLAPHSHTLAHLAEGAPPGTIMDET